jgi:plastocyanin
MKRAACFILLGAGLAGCGGSSSSSGPPTFTISGMAFSPTVLSAAPGATVTVRNTSALDHTFTSESAENAYTPGASGNVSFDKPIPATGETTVTIPANAVVGTSVWFYCKIHTTMMNQGYIQIAAAGSGGGY